MSDKIIKGWTRDQVERRVSLRAMQAQTLRSKRQERIEFDTFWGEWVIVSSYPGEPTTINRKPRAGLKRELTSRVEPDNGQNYYSLRRRQ